MAKHRFVWLDAMGVIFVSGDDVRELLIPFARARGSSVSDDAVLDAYRACSLGHFSSADLWARLGVAGEPSLLDDEHLAAHRVTPGIVEFVQGAARAGVRVGCVSNDVREWARRLRARHGLEALISPWVTSAEVGARKPDRAIYEHLCALTSLNAPDCVIVDDREVNLDVARSVGFVTVKFGGHSERHRSATDAAELATLLLEHTS